MNKDIKQLLIEALDEDISKALNSYYAVRNGKRMLVTFISSHIHSFSCDCFYNLINPLTNTMAVIKEFVCTQAHFNTRQRGISDLDKNLIDRIHHIVYKLYSAHSLINPIHKNITSEQAEFLIKYLREYILVIRNCPINSYYPVLGMPDDIPQRVLQALPVDIIHLDIYYECLFRVWDRNNHQKFLNLYYLNKRLAV